jgi:sugar lactone lactonase YvrE
MKRFHAVPASQHTYGLGEGPVWDADHDRVLWVDISAGEVHRGTLSAQGVREARVLHLQETVGAVVSARDGELRVAGARRLYRVAPDGAVIPGPELIADDTASRLNDGGCDPDGRFLVGSLALDDRAAAEVLVRVDQEGGIEVIDQDLGMSNGLAFSPAGDLLYSIDTIARVVWIRAYDSRSGAVGRRQEFLRVDGSPDGMCVDVEGNLWIAIWGAGEVRCHSAGGEPLAIVEVPAPNTTSVAFAGPALDTLLITTAAEQLSDAQRARYPDAGRLFTAQVDVDGLPVAPWAGAGAWPERFGAAMTVRRS